MKNIAKIAAFALLTIAALSARAETANNSVLTLDTKEGTAPLTVTLTGPEDLLQKIASCKREGEGGYGYAVEWGDDAAFAPCTINHTYEAPGTYEVKGQIYHHGPRDEHVIDWEGLASVEVKLPLPDQSPKPGDKK